MFRRATSLMEVEALHHHLSMRSVPDLSLWLSLSLSLSLSVSLSCQRRRKTSKRIESPGIVSGPRGRLLDLLEYSNIIKTARNSNIALREFEGARQMTVYSESSLNISDPLGGL